MNKTMAKRIDYIDIAKALGMLTIMWGHIHLSGWSFAFVYSFHIPLFFFLSGMVFDKNRYSNFKEFLKKKTKSLFIPYVIFSFVFWAVWALFSYLTKANVDSYWMPLAETFIAQGSGGFLVHNVPLWFVTCLIVVEALYYFLVSYKTSIKLIVCVSLAFISWYGITHQVLFDWRLLPWNIEVALLALPIFALGNFFSQRIGHDKFLLFVECNKVRSVIFASLAGFIVYYISQINGAISFGHNFWGKSILYAYASGIVGTIMMLIICALISLYYKNKENQVLFQKLKWFGSHSFDAMAIHNPIKGFVCVFLGYLLHSNSSEVSNNPFYSILALLLTLSVTILGMILIIKVRNISKR